MLHTLKHCQPGVRGARCSLRDSPSGRTLAKQQARTAGDRVLLFGGRRTPLSVTVISKALSELSAQNDDAGLMQSGPQPLTSFPIARQRGLAAF